MMKNLYISAWLILAAAVFIAALTNSLNPAIFVVFSLLALALIYALALWVAYINTREIKTE